MPEKTFFKKTSLIALISATALALTGCAELPAPAQVEKVDYRGCVLSQSDSKDQTLTEVAAYSLNQAAVTYGIQRTDLVSKSTKLASSVKKLVKADCKLIVISGAGFGDGLVELASNNPEVNFIFISDRDESKVASANLENLVTYGVDLYEVGLISSYIAASQSKLHYLGLTCGDSLAQSFLSGVKFGTYRFDAQNSVATRVEARHGSMVSTGSELPDVQITAGCKADLISDDSVAGYVGYGRDNYLLSRFDRVKGKVVATVIPELGGRLLEVVASDIEGDFIGGSLGSVVATFGNGLLTLSPGHEIAISADTITKLQTVIADYEATLK